MWPKADNQSLRGEKMAKIIEGNIPHGKADISKYPWEEWFDGQTRELTRGVDFTVTLASFRCTILAAGKRCGKRVITRAKNENTLLIQASDND